MSGDKTGLVLIAISSFPPHYVQVFASKYKLLFSELLYLYSKDKCITFKHQFEWFRQILKYETIYRVLWEVLEMQFRLERSTVIL